MPLSGSDTVLLLSATLLLPPRSTVIFITLLGLPSMIAQMNSYATREHTRSVYTLLLILSISTQ